MDVRFGLSKLTSQLRKDEIAGVFLPACNSTDACSRSSCLPRFSGRGLTGAGPFLKALAAMRPCDGMSGLVRGSRRKAVFAFKGLFSGRVFVAFPVFGCSGLPRFPEVRGKSETSERNPIFSNKTAGRGSLKQG